MQDYALYFLSGHVTEILIYAENNSIELVQASYDVVKQNPVCSEVLQDKCHPHNPKELLEVATADF